MYTEGRGLSHSLTPNQKGAKGTLFFDARESTVSVRYDPTATPRAPMSLATPRRFAEWDGTGRTNTSSPAQAYIAYALADMFRDAGNATCGKASVIPTSKILKGVHDQCLFFVHSDVFGSAAKVDIDAINAIVGAHHAASLVEIAWTDQRTVVITISIDALSAADQEALADQVAVAEASHRKRPRDDDDDDRPSNKKQKT